MSDKGHEEQAAALEALIERLFVCRFEEFEKKWDMKLRPLERDAAAIKHAVKVILMRLP